MKKTFYKIISFLPLGLAFGQIILPLKSLAALPQYAPLEPTAFGDAFAYNSASFGSFLSQAFQFGLAVSAALAVVMIVYGGVEIMLSESVFKKEDGKKKIKDAVLGLLLALGSWLILYTINPDILNFKIN